MSVRSPVRRSLLRRITWFGGDRRLVGGSVLLLLCLVGLPMFMSYGFFYGLPIIIPLGFFVLILWVAREAGKSDPWMVDVVMRQFKYRKYYAPKPDLGTSHPQVKDFI